MITEDQFWKWFIENSNQYFFLNQIVDQEEKDKLLDILLNKLHEYSNGLYFLIGGNVDKEQELIITAEGNVDFFKCVEDLVRAAPNIKNWHIIPFKPPIEGDFQIDYGEVNFDTRKMQFEPLEIPDVILPMGVKVFYPDFCKEKEEKFLMGTHLILDNLLGEKSYALNIDYVEVAGFIENSEKDDLLKIIELPNYISWLKSKYL